jgi:uncharacterized protein with PIN domain
MKFLVDNQLPASLALLLRRLGFEAEHVIDLGMDEASDLEIVAVASKRQAIIISKDGDFGTLSALGLCKAPITNEFICKTTSHGKQTRRLDASTLGLYFRNSYSRAFGAPKCMKTMERAFSPCFLS